MSEGLGVKAHTQFISYATWFHYILMRNFVAISTQSITCIKKERNKRKKSKLERMRNWEKNDAKKEEDWSDRRKKKEKE